MFAVFGKSRTKEVKRKLTSSTPEFRFHKNSNAYIVSPEYSSIERCYEFIELSEQQADIRCLYIAKIKHVLDANSVPELNKKTGKPKTRYVKIKDAAME